MFDQNISKPKKFLRLIEVMNRTGLRKSSVYLKMNLNEFPKNFKIGKRIVAWDEFEIEDWMIKKCKAN